MEKSSDCTLLILTYKGIHHLEYLLPTAREALRNSPNYSIDVLIVDNGCDEKTRTFSTTHFPEFKYEYSPANDYLFSLNSFAEKISTEFLFILNDDMKLHPNVINETLSIIKKDPKLFGVTCNIMDFDGQFETTGIRHIRIDKGWARIEDMPYTGKDNCYTWFAGGGAAVFYTKKYNELKGFDPLFRPAYCEDSDLSMRAWHKGWPTVYAPSAILYHRVSATIKDQMKHDNMMQLLNRQKIVLFTRNLYYQNFLLNFLAMLPYRLLLGWRVGKNAYIALWQSIPLVLKAIIKRKTDGQLVLKDEQIIELIGKKYELKN